MSNSQSIPTTARESALYQAGFEAGKAHAYREATQAFEEAKTYADGLMVAASTQTQQASDLAESRVAFAIRTQARQVASGLVLVRSSIGALRDRLAARAEATKGQADAALLAFNQQTTTAISLTRPPTILRRLVAAARQK